MRLALIFTLSSVLFKSYLRASRKGKVSLFSQPRIMLIADVIGFAAPVALLQYLLPLLPEEIIKFMNPIVWQLFVGLPILLTSAVILAGVLFELGQSAGLSSSEAVNWLPISPREYVAASAISIITAYSLLFSVGVGVTLPLALKFGLIHVWSVMVIISVLAFFLGALIVEILRAIMNRVSSTFYKRSGRLGMISRLVLLVVLFVAVQLAFNPYILYSTLGTVVSGIDLVWFIPMIWPSVIVMNLVRLMPIPATIFLALLVVFVTLVFETAARLRLRYWSPAPVSIVIKTSAEYVPHAPTIFGYTPLEAAIAWKEFRVLIRRKDMARFIAMPIMMVIAFILPMMLRPGGYSGISPGFFLAAFIPYMIPLMLSMITVGQEGRAVINLCMLPISAKEFIRGKLLPAWIISLIATIGAVGGFQIIAPMATQSILVALLAGLFIIIVQGFIGLGVGSRYPDFTVGPRSRYVRFTGFLVGFLFGGLSALAVFTPAFLYLISERSILGAFPIPPFGITFALPATIIIGSVLSCFAYRYCRNGVERFLSNLEV